eukprot:3862059-Amphidinium_carterae.4
MAEDVDYDVDEPPHMETKMAEENGDDRPHDDGSDDIDKGDNNEKPVDRYLRSDHLTLCHERRHKSNQPSTEMINMMTMRAKIMKNYQPKIPAS